MSRPIEKVGNDNTCVPSRMQVRCWSDLDATGMDTGNLSCEDALPAYSSSCEIGTKNIVVVECVHIRATGTTY